MQLKIIFTINYIYAFIFGIGFVFFPTLCSSMIGFNVEGDAHLIAQAMGLFVVFSGLLPFFARAASKSEARRAIVLSLFILYILLFLFKVSLNLFHGFSFNLMFAVIYVIHIGFLSCYGYFLFGKPREIES